MVVDNTTCNLLESLSTGGCIFGSNQFHFSGHCPVSTKHCGKLVTLDWPFVRILLHLQETWW